MDTRLSYEADPIPGSRLHKQKSNRGMRSISHGQQSSFPGTGSYTPNRGSGNTFGDGTKARKGSIRNAVRKIFGRRSRASDPDPPDPNYAYSGTGPTTRHTYHKSEPPCTLSPQPELPEPEAGDDTVQRTLSMNEPYPRPSLSRTTSPFAKQFPHSARLKPMDLGTPLITRPNHQLRRRKTLPSMLLEEQKVDASEDSTTKEHREVEIPSHFELLQPEAKDASSSVKKSRRKSRSTDDLQATTMKESGADRKRSQEIRYWRESYQPDVLRASGFRTKTQPNDETTVTRPTTPSSHKSTKSESPQEPEDQLQRTSDQFDFASKPATLKSSPPRLLGSALSVQDGEYRPSSGAGTEMSRDIEDRVAKLETGLQNFQRSLQKLTADRNRRTIVMGGNIATRRSSSSLRTPSLLADTLTDPLEPSSYEYEYGHTLRPSTSPKPLVSATVQGRVDDPFGPDPPPAEKAEQKHEHLRQRSQLKELPAEAVKSKSRARTPPQTTQSQVAAVTPGSKSSTQAQPYTFSSLYQMLADERSARRKLENQLKGLQQEISELHNQVNFSSSNMQSTRSSTYMLAGSSSRLQNLLRETGEGSPPPLDSSPRSLNRQSGLSAMSVGSAPVVSRFSGSDSEALAQELAEPELETPYEAYRTPREGRSKWSLAEKLEMENKGIDEMF